MIYGSEADPETWTSCTARSAKDDHSLKSDKTNFAKNKAVCASTENIIVQEPRSVTVSESQPLSHPSETLSSEATTSNYDKRNLQNLQRQCTSRRLSIETSQYTRFNAETATLTVESACGRLGNAQPVALILKWKEHTP
ncbi:uncharacterized protein LOC134185890 isoform X2 [Corticium candelabrum]|uniref:uncharacterized protein LOC134185890 isoform X2 n=1 Tax=Corticium candelabrum TaxID=121492 RepID=UPI002E2751BA|nr:uncharacterized protein LOC134185890 isoform X2 [Corticium candelabrum]